MKLHVRRWAVILLLAVLPATLFAQACELGCYLARMNTPMTAEAQRPMSDGNHEMSVAAAGDDACPMAALCEFAHLTALSTVLSVASVVVAPTFGVEPSHADFSSTTFPPDQRPPAA